MVCVVVLNLIVLFIGGKTSPKSVTNEESKNPCSYFRSSCGCEEIVFVHHKNVRRDLEMVFYVGL